MANKRIDLTESEIRQHIFETALNELDWRTYGNAAAKRIAQSKEERKLAKKSLTGKNKNKEAWKNHTILSRKRLRQAQKLGKMAQDTLNKQAEKGEKFVMSPMVADDEFPRGRYARISDGSGKKASGKSPAVTQAHNFFNGKSEYNKDKSMWESVKRAVTENVIRALAQTETGRRLTESTNRVSKRETLAPILEAVDRVVEGFRRMVCEAEGEYNGQERLKAIADDYFENPTEEDIQYINDLLKGCTLIISRSSRADSAPTIYKYADVKASPDPKYEGALVLSAIDLSQQGNPRVNDTMNAGFLCDALLGDHSEFAAPNIYVAHNEQEVEQAIQTLQAIWEKNHNKWEANLDGDSLAVFDFNSIPVALAEAIEEEAADAYEHESTEVTREWEFRDGSTIVASAEVEFYPEETYYDAGDWDTQPESGGYTSITITDWGVSIVDESRDGYEYTDEDIKALNIDWSPLDKVDEITW